MSEIQNNSDVTKKKSNYFFEWIVPIAIAIAISLFVQKFVLYKVYIPSESMVPTINEGDHLFVTRVYNPEKLQRGDIVVFKSDELNDILIKRLIGLPGDKISIADGIVSVNGEVLKEDYVKNNDHFYGNFEVPEGKYFFLGDNRAISWDARKWGNPYIDADDIMAKAQVRVYPFKDIGSIN